MKNAELPETRYPPTDLESPRWLGRAIPHTDINTTRERRPFRSATLAEKKSVVRQTTASALEKTGADKVFLHLNNLGLA